MPESVYMTRFGFEILEAELRQLKSVERPAAIKAIEVARAHGDLRENAEYEAAKHHQGFIEGRIKDLEYKIAKAKVVDLAGQKPDKVIFGTIVTIEDEDSGEHKRYQIVGEDEADIAEGKINYKSPIARALLGHGVEDDVRVQAPGGERFYTVVSIEIP